jgi:hypothetical protein
VHGGRPERKREREKERKREERREERGERREFLPGLDPISRTPG